MGLRELVLADLKRAQRLIALIEDELDPQFRIGDHQQRRDQSVERVWNGHDVPGLLHGIGTSLHGS